MKEEKRQEKGCAGVVFAFVILLTIAAICMMYFHLQMTRANEAAEAGAAWFLSSMLI